MKKVLIVNTLGLHYEGITSVIYNFISNMDRSGFQIDFISFEGMNPELKKSFEELGNIIITPKRKKDVKGYIAALNKILSNGYDIIHVHGNSGTMAIETVLAKKHKVKRIIVHCHNTTCNHPVVNKMLIPIMKATATDLMSCSKASGKWLYGNSSYTVLNNAIKLDRFEFDPQVSKECRRELGIFAETVDSIGLSDYVVGNIGHFHEQKNHTFLIDIFAEFHKIYSNSKLLLVSDGPKLQEIKDKVNSLGLTDSVIFAGRRSDPQRLYQAMDIFVLPSLWEGLPVVMLEAQAAGLPLLVSDTVTTDAKCCKSTVYKSLNDGAKSWAEEIFKIKTKYYSRNENAKEDVAQNGFDIVKEADKLRRIYNS